MTIVILFHQLHYRDFKAFYEKYVQQHLSAEFPKLVSYKRFVALKQRIGIPLYVYLYTQMGRCTGISFIDSTPLRVCHNRRIPRHRVFDGWYLFIGQKIVRGVLPRQHPRRGGDFGLPLPSPEIR